MTYKQIYSNTLYLGFLIWASETVYFGGNLTPMSGAERLLDYISGLMMITGGVGSCAITAAEQHLRDITKK